MAKHPIYELATSVQHQTNAVKSLIDVIELCIADSGFDNIDAESRMITLLSFMRESAEKARAIGEQIEVIAMGMKA